MSKDPRGAIVRPQLAALPAVSKGNSYRLVLQGGVLQVSINSAAYVPLVTGAVVSSPWEETGDPSGATPDEPNVSLVNPQTFGVVAALRDAVVGETAGGDFGIAPGVGQPGSRAGELRVTRNIEAESRNGTARVLTNAPYPSYFGGIYLEDAALAQVSGNLAPADVVGPFTNVLCERGDMVADPSNARIRLGNTGGIFRVRYSVTFTAVDPGVFTFMINFGTGTLFAGRQAVSLAANETRHVSGEHVFFESGVNQDVELACQTGLDPPPAYTLIHASLVAYRIA